MGRGFLSLKFFFLKSKGTPSGAQERKGMDGVFAASAVG
jgi:hypothetical protein